MNNCSIIKEIKKAEDSIQSCYKRLTILEKILKSKKLPPEQRRTIENELLEVRKLLATNEDHLSQLHGQNRRTFAVAASLFFSIFLIYGIYVLMKGGDL
ncbi:hypothetical protein CBL_11420 [Carabus blaptoides fortunei]